MFSVEIPINLFALAFAMFAAGFIGFSLRGRQLKKKQFKIVELRKEMVDNHAHILELQKEYVDLEMKFYARETPVLAFNKNVRNYDIHNHEVLDSAI
jgi:hypothetical protein